MIIFSKLNPVYKTKVTLNELCKLHDIELFPVIPNDITGLMKDLIMKCLDRNYETRINIAELSKNLNIFLDNIVTCKIKKFIDIYFLDDHKDNNIREPEGKNIEIFRTDNRQLEDTYKYIHKLDDTLTKNEQFNY